MIEARSGRGGRLLPAVTFVGVLLLGVAGFWMTRDAARRNEERLLRERAGEVAALLSSSTERIASELRLLGEMYAGTGGSGPGVAAATRSLVTGNVLSVAVAESVGGDVFVRAGAGSQIEIGEPLAPERAEVTRRALAAGDLVSGLVQEPSGETTLILAHGHDDGLIVYQESRIVPQQPAPSTPESPFRALNVVLYRQPTEDPANLLVTTSDDLPLTGITDRRDITVGAERWLLIASARDSLAGDQARALPWVMLGGGALTAVVAAGAVALMTRRRAFALQLVEERTAELRRTMSDLEAAREMADNANRSKDLFLSRMSHELRTPLNAVLGFAQLLDLGALDETQRDAVAHILKGGHHLLELINEVLDIARIESGNLSLSPEAVLLRELVDETCELMRPLAAARSIHVSIDRTALDDHYVFADRHRFKQVLLNVLSNAIKYNRVGGTVSVSCEQTAPNRLRILITDTGPGIRADQLGLLFAPFERLDAAHTDIEGTGIGLALSRKLAEAMSGALDVETTSAAGSTFFVELPLVEGPVERYQRLNGNGRDHPLPERQRDRKQSVLYIEDNLANLKLVQLIAAQRDDLEILPAMQGRLGLDLARQHRPALILLDLHLPDIAGDLILHELRHDPSTAAIPVVIVSADATPGQIQRLRSAGASAYLTKPFNVRDLLRTIDELLPNNADDPTQ